MVIVLNPQRYHDREHKDASFENCGRCRRAQVICQKKIRFATWIDADEWIAEYHESKDYAKPWAYRYRCRWCDAWHMTTIRDRDRVARARVEKQRRKWLTGRRFQ